MQKVDKLHITANKGAGEQHCCSQSLDLSHMTNDTDRWWIIHVVSVQKPQIQPLKGRLVFFFPRPSPLCGHQRGALDCSTSQPVDGMGDFSLLPEEIVKDGGFLPSLTVFIKMLHKSAASLSRLSIRSYLLDLNSKYLN